MESRSWALISRHRRSRTPARCFHHSRDRSHSWYRACNVSSRDGVSSNGSADERRVRLVIVVMTRTWDGEGEITWKRLVAGYFKYGGACGNAEIGGNAITQIMKLSIYSK